MKKKNKFIIHYRGWKKDPGCLNIFVNSIPVELSSHKRQICYLSFHVVATKGWCLGHWYKIFRWSTGRGVYKLKVMYCIWNLIVKTLAKKTNSNKFDSGCKFKISRFGLKCKWTSECNPNKLFVQKHIFLELNKKCEWKCIFYFLH